MDVTSKLMPRWMEIKTEKSKPIDLFKSIEYNNPVKQKAKRQMAFVDKELNLKRLKPLEYNNSRSVFSYQDFRNDVNTSKEAKYYGEKVSQKPKRFFEWDRAHHLVALLFAAEAGEDQSGAVFFHADLRVVGVGGAEAQQFFDREADGLGAHVVDVAAQLKDRFL